MTNTKQKEIIHLYKRGLPTVYIALKLNITEEEVKEVLPEEELNG